MEEYKVYATENANHKIFNEDDFLYNFILGFKNKDYGYKEIIKIYSTSDNGVHDLYCELIFNEDIDEKIFEYFIDMISCITIVIEPNKSVKYYDKTFKRWRSIKTIAAELNNRIYVLDEISEIKVCKTNEKEMKELRNIKKESR